VIDIVVTETIVVVVTVVSLIAVDAVAAAAPVGAGAGIVAAAVGAGVTPGIEGGGGELDRHVAAVLVKAHAAIVGAHAAVVGAEVQTANEAGARSRKSRPWYKWMNLAAISQHIVGEVLPLWERGVLRTYRGGRGRLRQTSLVESLGLRRFHLHPNLT